MGECLRGFSNHLRDCNLCLASIRTTIRHWVTVDMVFVAMVCIAVMPKPESVV
jgi:hypothetical protein